MQNVNLVPLNQISLLTEVMSREILKLSLSITTRGYSVLIVKSSFRYNFRTVINILRAIQPTDFKQTERVSGGFKIDSVNIVI